MAKTPRRRRSTAPADTIKLKGFVRMELVDVRGPHKGRRQITGWMPNVVTAEGLQNYIVGPVGGIAGSKQITHLVVATQTTAPSSSQTSASGEFEARKSTTNSFVANGTLRMVCSYATNEATQSTLGALAVYNQSSGGSAASIATFSTSNKTTDQTLNITYEYRFS